MGYQSKTYSLSDEVVEAIEAAKAKGVTPNQLLKSALLDSGVAQLVERRSVKPNVAGSSPAAGAKSEPVTKFRDASVPAGARTLPPKMVDEPRPHTMHSGVRPVPGCKQCEGMK
jgi:hypothetical protein